MTVSTQLHHIANTLVRLTFVNDSPQLVTLAGPKVGVPEFDGNYFEFDPALGEYLGWSDKSTLYPSSQLFQLEPGEELCHEVDLSHVYRGVGDGFHTRYFASHPTGGGAGGSALLVSNWITVKL